MNELKERLELEDKEYLVATILDLQNMVDHQRRQLLNKDRTVDRFRESNIIYEDTLKLTRKAILDLLKGIVTEQIHGEAIMFHLEQLRDSL